MTTFIGADGKGRSVSPTDRLPVDIGADVNIDIGAAVEINNDTGNPIPTAPNITRGGGAIDANTQRVTLASDGPTVSALGAQADAAATSDNGAFSIIALIKRGLQNWTTLLARIPALISGRVPVDGSGVTQPVEPLGVPGVARQLSAGATSANTTLTTTCRRLSMRAVSADIRYAIGSTSQTATGTSHLIGIGERLDVAVPATPNIAIIRAGTTSGTLEITELL